MSDDKGKTITLKENKESKSIPFSINKGNSKTLTIQVDIDNFDAHPILKKGIKNLKKYPDYIIFCENKTLSNSIYVFIAELKSINPEDWHRQAKAGLTIAQYLIGMLENYLKKKINNIQYRCLLFHTKNPGMGMSKKKKTASKAFEYEQHPIFEYKYTDKRSDNPAPYELEMFIR